MNLVKGINHITENKVVNLIACERRNNIFSFDFYLFVSNVIKPIQSFQKQLDVKFLIMSFLIIFWKLKLIIQLNIVA